MKRREGARDRERKRYKENKEKGRGDSNFDRICNPITQLRYVIEVNGEVVVCSLRAVETLDFSFLPGRLTLHLMQVKGRIWN